MLPWQPYKLPLFFFSSKTAGTILCVLPEAHKSDMVLFVIRAHLRMFSVGFLTKEKNRTKDARASVTQGCKLC